MRALVVTVSDRVSRGEAEDRSGPAAAAILEGAGFEVDRSIVPDGIDSVATELGRAAGSGFDLVVTTGGTGMAPRDLTPEATRRVLDREAPGLAEAMRAATFGRNPHGMLSRGVCGIVGSTLVLNLPGSERGAIESLEVVVPALRHGVELIADRDTEHGEG